MKLQKDPSLQDVISQLQNILNVKNWCEIIFCGFGEPLERLDTVCAVTKWIKRYYGKVVSVRVDTNGCGSLINKDRNVHQELMEAGVDKISVSLNAENSAIYAQICHPKFHNTYENILEFTRKAKEHFEVEVTAVTIPEVNLTKIKEVANAMGANFRRREYVSYAL